MSMTIIITESQERMLKRYLREGIASLKQEECTDMPENFDKRENGVAGTVAGRQRPLAHTDKIANELSPAEASMMGRQKRAY